MRHILFLCLFSTAFFAELGFAKLPVFNSGINAVYGTDDRELITEKSSTQIKKLAGAVALIVSVDVLDIGFFRTTIKASSLKDNLNMCVSENFVTRPSVGGCTGFLVAPDIMATAGHCFQNDEDCATKKIIFDVDSHNQNKNGYVVLSHNVYSCKEIIKAEMIDEHDYALIRLDHASKRMPLKMNKSTNKIADDATVFMIGHPLGLPLILSKSAPVSDNRGVSIFKTALDSFEGNSGSPVFNAKTFEVEGILVNGQEDFVLDSNGECYRNKSYDGAGGEGVSRIGDLLPFIK
ncbi:MAG: trypsin-like peptidase domain-containing protein [Bacteriovorax sp.]|nr:trypsin-like peptidase domain-containing protein [Bacteriovorax sp.]